VTLRFIDKYEIVTTLGRGSMGVVYKAKDPEIGRLVAIKTLKSVFMGDDAAGNEALQRFRQESRSAGKLHHPNIVTIFEAGRTENGSPYIVMEYIEGKSLESLLAESGPLDPLAALHYLSQIASAIDYAHSQSVIHRDIKPSNIIVDATHRPYLLDFGVAKLSDTSLTPAGTVVGTPSYMSPEQIRGSQLDGRTDLFSLVVVAFEAFTGSRPFPGTDFTTVVSNIIHKAPLTFAELGVDLAPELEKVLAKGLSKERDERYPSALEFVDAAARAFGVVVDGGGLAGGYVPGLKIPDVAARESALRNRAATVVGAFQPSALGVAEGVSESPPPPSPNDQFSDAATGLHARPNYTNGASIKEEVANPSASAASKTPTRFEQIESKPAQDSKKFLMPVLALLGVAIICFAAYAIIPPVLHSVREMFSSTESESSSSSEPEDVETAQSSSETSPPIEQPTAAPTPSKVTEVEVPPGPRWLEPQKPAGGFTEASIAALKDSEIGWLLGSGNADTDSLRLAIAEAAKRPNRDLTDALSTAGMNSDFKVRVDVLKAISKSPFHYHEPIAQDAIKNALKDKEFIVRGFAVKTYAAVAGQEAVPTLEAMAKDETNAVVSKVITDSLNQLRASAGKQ